MTPQLPPIGDVGLEGSHFEILFMFGGSYTPWNVPPFPNSTSLSIFSHRGVTLIFSPHLMGVTIPLDSHLPHWNCLQRWDSHHLIIITNIGILTHKCALMDIFVLFWSAPHVILGPPSP